MENNFQIGLQCWGKVVGRPTLKDNLVILNTYMNKYLNGLLCEIVNCDKLLLLFYIYRTTTIN